MKPSLLITGASGFIGRHLLQRLDPQSFENIFCLTRGAGAGLPAYANVRILRGGLLDSNVYFPALSSSSVVIHLAAATGAAPASEHFRTNRGGTDFLARQATAAGVRGFLYVSSIAARFSDTRNYPYAQSKQQAEEAVRSSGLPYAIVRPTIVLGAESPIGQRLKSLANRLVTTVIGPGTVRVQPVDVDDLADLLVAIVAGHRFNNETLEIGGPDVLTMHSLLARLSRTRHGREPRIVHIPDRPLKSLLVLMERLPLRLPVSAGQLASFTNEGTAEPNDLVLGHRERMKGIQEMIQLLTNHG